MSEGTEPLESDGYVNCIGTDGKIHVCEPQKQVTKCGMKIKSKNLGKTDYDRLSCYSCTY